MSGGYISQKIEDEVQCFGIAFYKRRCIVKKNRVLEVPRLLAVIKTDDWGTFLKSYFVADEKVDKKKVAKNVLTHPCLVVIYLGFDLHGDAGEASSRHHGDSEVSWGLQQRPHDADRGNDFGGCKNYNDL